MTQQRVLVKMKRADLARSTPLLSFYRLSCDKQSAKLVSHRGTGDSRRGRGTQKGSLRDPLSGLLSARPAFARKPQGLGPPPLGWGGTEYPQREEGVIATHIPFVNIRVSVCRFIQHLHILKGECSASCLPKHGSDTERVCQRKQARLSPVSLAVKIE